MPPRVPLSIHLYAARKHGNKDRKQLGRPLRKLNCLLLFGAGKCLGARAANCVWELRQGWQKREPGARTHCLQAHPSCAPSYVTGDLAFPSNTARVNDACVHIHNYTTLLFLAAQTNNSCPPGRTHADYVLQEISNARLCGCSTCRTLEQSSTPSCDVYSDYIWRTLQHRSRHRLRERNTVWPRAPQLYWELFFTLRCPLTRPQPPEIIGSCLTKCVKYNSVGK